MWVVDSAQMEGDNFDDFMYLILGYVHPGYSNFDEKMTLEFFKRAAKTGNPRALYELGLKHYEGKSTF